MLEYALGKYARASPDKYGRISLMHWANTLDVLDKLMDGTYVTAIICFFTFINGIQN